MWLIVSQVLEMRLLGAIFNKLISVGVIALIVIFQEDIRKFLFDLGTQKGFRRIVGFFKSTQKSEKKQN